MNRQRILIGALILGLLLAPVAGLTVRLSAPGEALAQRPSPSPWQGEGPVGVASLGTAFTYQGSLTDGGNPATGSYDFEFKLYDDLDAGSQVGSTVKEEDVAVTNGLFTVELDFGASVFTGDARYLAIGVRPGGSSGAYTPLNPRQALTATPYALYARSIPLAGSGSAATAARSDHTHPGSEYQNVIIVAKSGGNFTGIQAALDSITDNSTANRYLVWVAPGTYDETVTMKQYVDIEGAGELLTTIQYTGSLLWGTGTVVGANNAELRFLTVKNTGGNNIAIAICNSSASPRLTHVTATATGGTYNYGVYNSGSSPVMTNATISVSGDTSSYNTGVYNSGSSPMMTNVAVSASMGIYNYGVYNDASAPRVQNSTISASVGIVGNCGIYNTATSGSYTVSVNNSQVKGSSNTIRNDAEFTTRVGASQLEGGVVLPNGGTVTCAGVYDESYTFYASTCP